MMLVLSPSWNVLICMRLKVIEFNNVQRHDDIRSCISSSALSFQLVYSGPV